MTLPSGAVLALFFSCAAFGQTYTIDTLVGGQGAGMPVALHGPQAVAVDSSGNVYFSTQDNRVLRRDAATGAVAPVAGTGSAGSGGDNGPATKAQLRNPTGIAVDAGGNVYIADTDNNRVRKMSKGIITTVAGGGSALGDGGQATKAQLQSPTGVAVNASGDIFIADNHDNRIQRSPAQRGLSPPLPEAARSHRLREARMAPPPARS